MKIVQVGTGVAPIPASGYGGIERTVGELSEALRRAGHEVEIVNTVRRGRSRDQFLFSAELGRRLAGRSADVVHAHLGAPGCRLKMLRVPYVYTSHHLRWVTREGWIGRVRSRLERRAVGGATVVVAMTEALAAGVRRAFPQQSIASIPLGIDTDLWTPGPEGDRERIALGVGAIVPRKRWELAARALAGTSLRLRLAGPVVDRRYAERVRAAGPVEILGSLSEEELRREYRRASVLVHPSAAEVFPGVVLQAYACALPVVGGPTVAPLVLDGRTGFASPADEEGRLPSFLREAAERIVQRPDGGRSMGAEARRLAVERFSWPEIVAQHLRAYQLALERGGPALPLASGR